jgi:hypothetical protein
MKWHRKTLKTAMLLRKLVVWQAWRRRETVFPPLIFFGMAPYGADAWSLKWHGKDTRPALTVSSHQALCSTNTPYSIQTPFLEFAVLSRRWIDRWPWAITVVNHQLSYTAISPIQTGTGRRTSLQPWAILLASGVQEVLDTIVLPIAVGRL